ncbi:transposase [Streptomyces iranensis]|uniref:transposase n=1 Tax=Streptomyces iranensis TaxID=576784 RepID=UPI003CD05734
MWELVAPLLPSFAARPQGGGTAPCDARAVFTAVVYVLTSSCAWRHLRRRSVRPPLRHIAGSQCGPRRACGAEYTGWCRTNAAPGARWTRPRRSSTRRPSGGTALLAVADLVGSLRDRAASAASPQVRRALQSTG